MNCTDHREVNIPLSKIRWRSIEFQLYSSDLFGQSPQKYWFISSALCKSLVWFQLSRSTIVYASFHLYFPRFNGRIQMQPVWLNLHLGWFSAPWFYLVHRDIVISLLKTNPNSLDSRTVKVSMKRDMWCGTKNLWVGFHTTYAYLHLCGKVKLTNSTFV